MNEWKRRWIYLSIYFVNRIPIHFSFTVQWIENFWWWSLCPRICFLHLISSYFQYIDLVEVNYILHWFIYELIQLWLNMFLAIVSFKEGSKNKIKFNVVHIKSSKTVSKNVRILFIDNFRIKKYLFQCVFKRIFLAQRNSQLCFYISLSRNYWQTSTN